MSDESTQEVTGSETVQQAAATGNETISKEEHQRELDRYRNQFGQSEKERKALEKRLADLEAANQTEAERLQAKAKRADELEPELAKEREAREEAEAAVIALVDEQKKLVPKEMAHLIPEGMTPPTLLKWLVNFNAALGKQKQGNGLPGAGGRNPGAQDKAEITEEQRQQNLRRTAARF